EDAFVCRYDSDGALTWARRFGGVGNDPAYDVGLNSLGGAIIAGGFQSTADFDPGPNTQLLTSAGNYDAYVVSLGSSGDLNWSIRLGGVDDDFGRRISFDDADNVYTTGWFSAEPTIAPGTVSAGIVSAGGTD